jgi:small subunit ribosomal protein S18
MAFQRKTFKFRPVAKNCPFCATKTVPDYKDGSSLDKYTSERGKILSKARTGLCSTHQRMVTTEVKHARFIGLMPFIVRA